MTVYLPFGEGVMGNVIRRGADGKFLFWCCGCSCHHWFDRRWTWNEDYVRPTANPSIHVPGSCHLWVQGGLLVYLWDCSHALAGKTVPMEVLE